MELQLWRASWARACRCRGACAASAGIVVRLRVCGGSLLGKQHKGDGHDDASAASLRPTAGVRHAGRRVGKAVHRAACGLTHVVHATAKAAAPAAAGWARDVQQVLNFEHALPIHLHTRHAGVVPV